MANIIKSLIKSFVTAFSISIFVSFLIAGTTNHRIQSYDLEENILNVISSNTIVFDKSGNKIAEFERDKRGSLKYDEIPIEMIEAVVATEDREFFDHPGVDPETIFRALLINMRTGDFSQGGSTITQQLVKQIYLNPGKEMERKQREAILSTVLEKKISKKEIISFYINHNFYGHQSYGLESAIETLFGQTIGEFKKEDKVTRVSKAALLAGIPNAPSLYDPYTNYDRTKQRRDLVLTNMYVEGYIDKNVYNEALKKDLLVSEKPNTKSANKYVKYPEFVHYALSETADKLGKNLEEIMYGGYEIHTTFNHKAYNAIRKSMSRTELYPRNPRATEGIQGSATFVDPTNGEIIAMTGARTEITDFLVLNRAFQSKRQPGSSFKPLISYGPALESGKFTRSSPMKCQSEFRGGYTVRDYGCYGSPSMQESIRVSKNATAVWALDQVGIEYARNYVKKLGIKLDDEDIYLPMALGGIKNGVTTLEMADAYQAYSNNGTRTPAHGVTKVISSSGEVVLKKPKAEDVIDPHNANEMKIMLRNVVTSGTGRDAQVSGIEVAGKTGTNERQGGRENTDIWFAGFTNKVSGAVWMGYDISKGNNFIPAGAMSTYPAKMFSEITRDLHKVLSNEDKKNVKKIKLNYFKTFDGSEVQFYWKEEKEIEYNFYENNKNLGSGISGEIKLLTNGKENNTYRLKGYDRKTGELKYDSGNIIP